MNGSGTGQAPTVVESAMSATQRRTWLKRTLLVALVSTGLTACGSASGVNGGAAVVDTSDPHSTESSLPTTTDNPTTDNPTTTAAPVPLPASDVPVVQYRVQGLFPVTPPFLQGGWTTIYADGTLIAPFGGSAAAQPQVWPYDSGHVDPERVAALMAMAASSGLLGPAGPAQPPSSSISDPARTVVMLTTADGTFTHVVDGLASAGSETDAYRQSVQHIVGAISTLVMDAIAATQASTGVTTFYEPVALDVLTLDVTDAAPGPGPANVVEWTPADVDLAAMATCTVVTDPEAITFLQRNLAGPTYEQHGRQYRIASRVHPPGTSCDG